MPAAEFFRQAGFFVVSDFLQGQLIVELRREMETAPKEKALILTPGGAECVDESFRKVEATVLPKEIRAPLKERLLELIPSLEQHFKVRLAGCETPHYLIYRPGDFFKPHKDGDYAKGNSETQKRRVSVVIFLNRESEEPAEGAYGQGRLTFYGLLDGPQWERCGFALNPEPGLLIAFSSDKIHEVTPVSHGLRFTVVTWFYAPEVESKDAESKDAESKPETVDPVAMTQPVQDA